MLAPWLVVGAGSWGTALAMQSARTGQATRLWGMDVSQWQDLRCNSLYFPELPLPEQLTAYTDLATAAEGINDFLLAVPSHAFTAVLQQLKPYLTPSSRVAWGTKGFDLERGQLLHEVAEAELGADRPLAILSGPSFALEVAEGLPTSVTLASNNSQWCADLTEYMHNDVFQCFTSADMCGVAIGGALKNIIAIAVGICDGLAMGANARCALITRGLSELTQLGLAMGAQLETLMGLSGLGDLVLTCTDDQSRNRRFGLALAQGHDVAAAEQHVGQVVEGKKAVKQAIKWTQEYALSCPIIETVYQMLYRGVACQSAMQALMEHQPQQEFTRR